MTTLSGKVALVTGGTSRIGKASAMSPTCRFASTHPDRAGAKVIRLLARSRFSPP